MILTMFGSEEVSGGILGFSMQAFVIQLITFIFVFLLLKKFAFKPIVAMLEKRRQTIEDGVLLGEKMEKRMKNLENESEKVIREARHEADRIIGNAHKETREIAHKAEKSTKAKADAMLKEAGQQIEEDSDRARRSLEKDIVGLVSEVTEAVVHEKVDAKKDSELIDTVLKDHKK